MRSSKGRYYLRGPRLFARVLAVMILLMATGSMVASSNTHSKIPFKEDLLSLWMPAFIGDADRNIEKYAIAQVQPPYPTAAQRYRIEGIVTVAVSVAKDGKVVKAEFVRGHTVFRSASLDA